LFHVICEAFVGKDRTIREILVDLRRLYKWGEDQVVRPHNRSMPSVKGSPFDMLADSTVRGWFELVEDKFGVQRWALKKNIEAAAKSAPRRGYDITLKSLPVLDRTRHRRQSFIARLECFHLFLLHSLSLPPFLQPRPRPFLSLAFSRRHPDFAKLLAAKYIQLRKSGVALDSNLMKYVALKLVRKASKDISFGFSRSWCRAFARKYCGFTVRAGTGAEDKLPEDYDRVVSLTGWPSSLPLS
jgi:hypothetical protein